MNFSFDEPSIYSYNQLMITTLIVNHIRKQELEKTKKKIEQKSMGLQE